MSGVLDSIGFVSGVLGIISFLKGNLPSQQAQGTTVQIKAGEYNDLDNGGGNVNAVFGYDYQNQYIGKSRGGTHINQGGYQQLTIDQQTPGIQADFVDVTFGNDAVCVAWISVKMHDGSPGGAWTGDIGKNCGDDWYHNSQSAGHYKGDSTKQYRPACSWFDGDHTNGFKYAGLKFRTRAYGESSQDTLNRNHQCSSTIFTSSNQPETNQPAKRDVSPLDKRGDTRLDWVKNTLVHSEIPELTAEELCNSETSYGSDFLDASGMFCDMNTKTLYPTCSVDNVIGCVKVEGTQMLQNVTDLLNLDIFKEYHRKKVWTEDD